ncbi:hypothetical protein [Streptomyces clavifer]|uniref:hypothetical protein n=1 Tax=Streptomyces clavifer TaxID=68188 RepID=UPI00308F5544|nr:hypothetical protein OG388_33560 [Streptomyces clavifer]
MTPRPPASVPNRHIRKRAAQRNVASPATGRAGRGRARSHVGVLDEESGGAVVDILARVQLSRAEDHVREFNAALAPWRREPTVREFIHRTRKELGVAA